jgi:hypothetical protein
MQAKPGLSARDFATLSGELHMKCSQREHARRMCIGGRDVNGRILEGDDAPSAYRPFDFPARTSLSKTASLCSRSRAPKSNVTVPLRARDRSCASSDRVHAIRPGIAPEIAASASGHGRTTDGAPSRALFLSSTDRGPRDPWRCRAAVDGPRGRGNRRISPAVGRSSLSSHDPCSLPVSLRILRTQGSLAA